MQLYGHFVSLTTLQVLTLLAEKHASVQLCLVDVIAKEQRAPEHRARHPFGHIPVLEDGGFTLYETHAILRYLDSRLGGPTFVPSDLKERARMDQWLCIEQNYLMPAAKKVNARGYAKMLDLPDPGEEVVKEGRQQLHFAIEQFARWIDGRAFIAGAAPSLADICWAADLSRMGASFEKKPMDDARINAWWQRRRHTAGRSAHRRRFAHIYFAPQTGVRLCIVRRDLPGGVAAFVDRDCRAGKRRVGENHQGFAGHSGGELCPPSRSLGIRARRSIHCLARGILLAAMRVH